MKNNYLLKNNKGGYVVIFATILFVGISLAFLFGIITPLTRYILISRSLINSKQALYSAESLNEDIAFRLKNSKPVQSTENLSVGGVSSSAQVVDVLGDKKITSTSIGDYSRTIQSNVTQISGASFYYALQSGNGGFQIANSQVIGNVNSSGSISGSNGAQITGGAIASSISNVNIGGDAWANSVSSSNITGSLYCQTGSNNNKSCNTSKGTPPTQNYPISDADIAQWKNDALSGGSTSTVSVPGTRSLGPIKINGDLTVGGTLNLEGNLWVTGNLNVQTNATIKLSSQYGNNGAIIVVDGKTSVQNNTNFITNASSSYIMIVSTSNCDGTNCSNSYAIDLSNNANAVIMNAQSGGIHLNNGAGANVVTGNKIVIDPQSTITYNSGLVNTSFYSGPSASWNINTWREIAQ